MKEAKQKLLIDQADRKLKPFNAASRVIVPPEGWINTIRKALKMSLGQMGRRLEISAQSVKEMEEREAKGTITLNTLREAGKAINMKLVYGFVPMDRSLNKMVEKRARELAEQIVLRTSHTMKLEDQGTTKAGIKKAIAVKTEELKMKMPGMLWD